MVCDRTWPSTVEIVGIKEIVDQLSIGEASVKSYVANILSKLDANTRSDAACGTGNQ